MNGILQTEAYVLGGRIYPPSAILTKKEFKDPDRLLMMEKNIRNRGNGVYFGRDFRRNCNDPQMKSITDMNLSHLVLSDDVEYAKQQRNYKSSMKDEKGRMSYSTKLRNPDGSELLQYSKGFVACSPDPVATHAHMISGFVGKNHTYVNGHIRMSAKGKDELVTKLASFGEDVNEMKLMNISNLKKMVNEYNSGKRGSVFGIFGVGL